MILKVNISWMLFKSEKSRNTCKRRLNITSHRIIVNTLIIQITSSVRLSRLCQIQIKIWKNQQERKIKLLKNRLERNFNPKKQLERYKLWRQMDRQRSIVTGMMKVHEWWWFSESFMGGRAVWGAFICGETKHKQKM